MNKKKRVIVVGGGLAGLSCAYKLAENGMHVTIVSVTKCRRSHSCCAQGGINVASNAMGEEDSPLIHAYDTIKGGDYLADQPPVYEMCMAGPLIIDLLDRMGCPFNRTPEGNLDYRRFGGTLYHRTAFCGASTGQQLLYSLDEQVRRHEARGNVEKMENHEFVRLIRDEQGVSRGIVYLDLFNLKQDVLKAEAVVFATGGLGLIFGRSTNSTFCTGAANGRLYQQGMIYANGEFIQIHPTAIPGHDKLRLMSESARGEGGRVFVPGDATKQIKAPNGEMIPCGKTGEPWYFLEEMYPAFGNLVPRDIGAREILRICEMGLGVEGKMEVYLDVSHLSKEKLHKLEAILDIYTKFTGDNPKKVPMRIFPGVHYSMGGAWVDWPAAEDPDREKRFRHMNNIPGCFNIGECDYQYHGANRLGANALLSCIYSGLLAGDEVPNYVETLSMSAFDVKDQLFSQELAKEEEKKEALFKGTGPENPFLLHDELAKIMMENVTVKRNNEDLAASYEQVLTLKQRAKNIHLNDSSRFANQTFIFANQLMPMLDIALVIIKGALLRDEFRGSHFKEGFEKRDDKNWLKKTLATYNPDTQEPTIEYLPVDTRYFEPALRDYSQAKKVQPKATNLPKKVNLPL